MIQHTKTRTNAIECACYVRRFFHHVMKNYKLNFLEILKIMSKWTYFGINLKGVYNVWPSEEAYTLFNQIGLQMAEISMLKAIK